MVGASALPTDSTWIARSALAGFALVAALAPACERSDGGSTRPAIQISRDPFTEAEGQHATAVEPDIAVEGESVVAAFQLGRRRAAGATALGWATSRDGGKTWNRGIVPKLTANNVPPGRADFVSDPVVAYDRAHRTWLIAALAVHLRAPGKPATSLVVSRSSDGRRWSDPVTADPESPRGLAHDKPWLECDTSPSSQYEGRCYLVWSGVADLVGNRSGLAISTSADGGRTWTRGTGPADMPGLGYLPVVRPDGSIVVAYQVPRRAVFAHRSANGGRSFFPAQFIAPVSTRVTPARNIRGLPLPSASTAADGRVVVAWHDCVRLGCNSNDLYLSTSADGSSWSTPRRAQTGDVAPLNEFLPALATRDDHLALLFYATHPRGCTSECRIVPYLVSSSDGARTWGEPHRLAPPRPLAAFPESEPGVRFLGDYNAAAFVGDDVLAVFAWAKPPPPGRYDQGVYAAVVPVDD